MTLVTQVGPGTVVELSYEAFDEEGDLVTGSNEGKPFVFVHGYGQLLPALEEALLGMSPGAQKSVILSPDEAYGDRDVEEILELSREDAPDAEVEDELVIEAADGHKIPVRVVEVWDDFVVVDANHPLAGMTLRFELNVEDVRPASDEELAVAEEALLAQGGCDTKVEEPALIQLRARPAPTQDDTSS